MSQELLINDSNMLTARLTNKIGGEEDEGENMTSNSCQINYIQSISHNRQGRLKRIDQNADWFSSLLLISVLSVYIPLVFSTSSSLSPLPLPSSSSLVNKRWSRSTLLSSNNNQLDLKFEITENSPAGTLIGVIRSPSGYQPCQPPFLIVPIRSGSSSSSSSSSSSHSNLRSGVDTDLSIDQASGEIRNSVVLDREETSYYTFIAIPFVGPNIKVTITILDSNDNAPLFPASSITLEFPENSKVRDVKRTLPPARDRDLGIFGTQKYRIISGNHGNTFRLVSHREKDDVLYHDLQVNGILDRESTSHYSLIVEALDGGLPPLSSQLLVNISILDVNDNEPIFTQSRYVATVLENATIGTQILQVTATDSDEGSNGKVEYSLPTNRRPGIGSTINSEASYFEINKDTGWIYLSRPVDFEFKDLHELVVVARDCGLQPLETSAFVSIRVLDVNDNRPTINLLFLTEDAQPIVPENALIGDFVARISINDPDSVSSTGLSSSSSLSSSSLSSQSESNKFMVTLSGGDGYFNLNRSDMAIYMVTVSKPLDREVKSQYSLTVTVSDSGNPPLNTSMVFDLEISDVNDNPPYFEQSVYQTSLPEVADPGTVVYKMKAIDRDFDSQVTYSFNGSNLNSVSYSWFTIDPETGLITTSSQIDCETDSAPHLVITATDGSSITATATLIVTISDVNDNEPIFDQSFYNVTTREDTQVGSCILRVSASDPDCGINSLVNYSSVAAVSLTGLPVAPMSIPVDSKSSSLIITSDFIVDPVTGDLCIARPLDFEKRRSYDIPIMATDRGGLSTTAMVKVTVIDVNDNGPIFYPIQYKVSVEENIVPLSKGRFIEPAPIVIVAATDADSPGSTFGTIRYSIRSGNEEKAFEIDPVTGRIYIVRPLSSAKPFYILTITATDGGDRESVEPALVHVSVLPQGGQSRPYSPIFSQRHYNFDIKENSLTGTKVGSVSATTTSSSSPLTYAIYSGDPDGYFTIDPSSGVIRVNSESIDAEKYSSLLLNVQAKEGQTPGPYRYGHTQVNISIINVNDNHPTFGTDRLKIAIPENMVTHNVTVLLAQASDADSDDLGNLTYSLQDTSFGSELTPFIIEKSTGSITLRSTLDYEKINHYRLIVTATDGGGLSCSMAVDVNIQDVNDCVPYFVGLPESGSVSPLSGFNLILSEDTPVNTHIYQLRANDGDTGNNARLTYSLLTSGSTDIGDNKRPKSIDSEFPFGIFPNNGILYTRRPLDRETRDNYVFTIQVTDHGSPIALRSTTSVTVKITDTNDNRPSFTLREWSYSISESAPPGTIIGSVSANDPDLGTNGTLKYSIFKGFSVEASKFVLDPTTGEISLKTPLDRETKDRYIFKIDAHDSGSPTPLSAESKATVIVDVSDVNDNPPSFINDETSGNSGRQIIALGSLEGTYVTTVKATDPDSGINGSLFYSLVDSDSNLFVIGCTNGVIKTSRAIEKLASYRVGVQVTDGGGLKSAVKFIQIDTIQRSFTGSGQSQQPVHRSSSNPTRFSSSDSSGETVYHEFRVHETTPVGNEVGTINVALPEVTANFFHRFSYCLNGYYVRYERPNQILSEINETSIELGLNKFVVESNDFSTIYLIVGQPLDYESNSEYSFQIYVDPWQCALTLISLDKTNNHFPAHQTSGAAIGKNYQLIATVKLTIIDDTSDCHPFEMITRDLKESNGTLLDLVIPISEETIHQRSIDLYPLAEAWSVGCTGLNLNYRLRSLTLDDGNLNRLLIVTDKSILTLKPFDKELIDNLVSRGELIIIVEAFLLTLEEIGTSLFNRVPIQSQAIRLSWVKDTGRNMDKVNFNVPTTYTFPEDCCHQNENILRLPLNISHDHFEVSYRLSEVSGRESVFSINSENGLIVLMEPFDYEKTQEYKLNVTASIYLRTSTGPGTVSNFDRTGSSSSSSNNQESTRIPIRRISKIFTIKITNINDERPIFTQSNYNREILESVVPGTLVTTIEAKDADSNSDLTYLIPPGHEEYKYFSIDRKTGALKTLIGLDRETREIHRIPVFVFDEDYVHSASTVVTVVLLDVNDNQPIFSSVPQSVKIPENILPGTIFHTIIASDLDTQTSSVNSSVGIPASLEYSILNGNEEGKFGINRATGQLSTLSPLDRERKSGYNLTIQVSDSLHTNRCNLTVELIDVNDNSPIFDKSVYYAVLDESRLANCDTSGSRVLSVVKVKAVDPDSDNSIYYTILASGSPEAMYFTIDPITGLITTDCAALAQARKAKLVNLPGIDYVASNPTSLTLSFDVLAIDVGSSPYAAHTTKTTIQVTVMGSPDSDAPRLTSYPTVIEVSGYKEDYKVGSEIGRINVVASGDDQQRTGSTSSTSSGLEGKPPGDSSSSPSSASLIFTIIDEDPNLRFSDYFNLDSRTGSITVKKSLIYGHHEAFVEVRRTGSTYSTLTLVQVILSGEMLSASAIGSSEFGKRARPSIPYNVSLFENVPLGTEVINLMSRYRTTHRGNGHNEARSPLADYQFQFAFTSVNQSTFYLYPNTGIITIRKLLDFETDPSRIELVVVARKRTSPLSEPLFFTVTIAMINVNDNAPRFTQAHYISTVREGESKGSFVTQISALDVDNVDSLISSRESIDIGLTGRSSPGKSTVTYHILEGNHDNAFIIDPPGSGIVKTNIVLDREIRDHYVLTIVANDEGPTGLSSASRDSRNLVSTSSQLSSHCTLEINVIDINDNVPVFPPYQEISVFEDAEVGATVASLTANDVDTFPPLTYYQKRSHLDGLSDNIDDLFDIGLYSGRITLKSRLDRSQPTTGTSSLSSTPSQPNQYKIAVLASDSLNTIETQVVIKVKPKNIYQRPPVFEQDHYFVPIRVNTHPCVLSGSVNCKIVQVSTVGSEDVISDVLPRLKVTYKLTGGPTSSKGFYIDSYTGVIYNNRSLGRFGKGSTTGSMFQLTVIAGYTNEAGRFISGHKAKSSILIVIPGGINVANISLPMPFTDLDSSSREEQTTYSITVKRDSVDQILLELDGFESDTFTLTNGNVDRAFALIRGHQLIMTKRLTRSEYKLSIVRRSVQTETVNNNPITLTVNIKVTSEESGNVSTAFKSQMVSVSISETSPPGHQVISVRSDSDQQSFKYSIYSGNELEAFRIDEVTGIVLINKSLDYEMNYFHQLTIMAKPVSSSRMNDKTDLCIVNINIINENDNRPKFALQSYKIIVDENTPIGTPIVKIIALDADLSSLNYSFLPSIDGLAPFGLDHRSGYIVTTEAIDYESLESSYSSAFPTFKMVLKAIETSTSSAEVLIEASIGSIDEYPPKFTSERYDFKVTTSYGIPTVIVGQVAATDGDLGPDGQVFYSIRSSSPPGAAKKFALNSTTGLITINTAAVDKIPPHFSSLVISASSGRADSLSSLTRIGINLILTDDKSTLHSSINNEVLQSGPLYDGSNLSSSSPTPSGPQVSSLSGWVMFLIICLVLVTCVLFIGIFAIRSHLFEQSPGAGHHHHHHHATGHHHQSFMTTSALASIVPGVGTLLRKIGANRGSSGDGCTHIGNTTIDSMNDTSTTYDHASFQGLHHLVSHHHGHSTSYLTSGQHGSLPPCYNEVNSLGPSGSTPRGLSNRPSNGVNGEGNSASSGRGSAEEDEVEGDLDGVDEEVRMINEGDGYHTFGLDNLGPTDEHELIPTTAEYLARLVIFDPDVAVREDDLDTLAEEVQSKAGSESKSYMNRSKSGLSTTSLRDRKQLRRLPIVPPIVDESEWNDLSCIEEELSDAYSWDYLDNWAPQYQPLANVYTEIATLKGAIHYDNTIGSSSSGLSDSPAYMRTSSTPAGDDNHHETISHHSHSTTASRSTAHLAIPSTSQGHHPLSNSRLSTLNSRGHIPSHQSSSSITHGSAFIPFGTRSGNRSTTNAGLPCDNRLKGIASDSSSDASTATAVFIDNDSSDRLRI